ncbi:type IV secretion system DNA-binding domain-containing protein, partial [Serratia marcescens]
SGKSVILKHILEQLTRKRDAKLFLYDIKGDFTSIFKRPIIVSPFDARSHVWDVAADVRTPTQAAAFAASIIPEGDGNAKFW